MDQLLSQLPLVQRIPALADGIRACRQNKAQIEREEAELLQLLRDAETQLRGSQEEAEGVAPSGLLDEPAAAPQGKGKGK